jgi:hypothetical protein
MRNPGRVTKKGMKTKSRKCYEVGFCSTPKLQRQARQKDFRKKGKNALLFMAHSKDADDDLLLTPPSD